MRARLVVELDITDPASARVAVDAAVARFGRIDVLVNNAGNFYAGFFEEVTPESFRAQTETNLFGPLNVAPFGIGTMIVEPGFFRADLLEDASTTSPVPTIDDYAQRTKDTIVAWRAMNGRQGGDPAKLARALVQLAGQDESPLRWVAGADAVATAEAKATALLAQVDAYRDLFSQLAHDDATP
jgi:NAD(P)-dependent dehydrogenase (short-subunit alcohol dehydrogenase family)